MIDHRELTGQVQMLTSKELIFLDGYGYHLRIDAIDGKPISVYDEADNRVYELSEKLDSDGCLWLSNTAKKARMQNCIRAISYPTIFFC